MPSNIPIPQLAEFERRLNVFAPKMIQSLANQSQFTNDYWYGRLTYYDAGFVMFQLYDYAVANNWPNPNQYRTAAINGVKILRDVFAWIGGVEQLPGYQMFSHGLAEDWIRNGNTASRDACLLMASGCAYPRDETAPRDYNPEDGAVNWFTSREVSYCISAYLNAEKCGAARRSRLGVMVDFALGHINQWFVQKTTTYIAPFMVGLTVSSLIEYAEVVSDNRILPAIKTALDGLKNWPNLYDPLAKTFRYHSAIDPASTDSVAEQLALAPDLNQLIGKGYAWYYHKTGDLSYRTMADQLFEGGVLGAYFGAENVDYRSMAHKQFNQSHRLVFQAIKYSTLDPVGTSTGGGGVSGGGGPGTGGSGVASDTPSGTIIRAFRSTPLTMLMPVLQHTYQAHFVNNGWTKPADQIAAGYPIYVQPSPATARAIMEVDLESLISDVVQIDVIMAQDAIFETVTITPKILVSPDGVSFTTFAGVWNAKAGNVRYIRVELIAVGSSPKALTAVPQVSVRVTVKEKTEAGSVSVNAADTNGTFIPFRKKFADIISVNVSAKNQGGIQLVTAYDLDDVANPTGFNAFLFNRANGDRVSGVISWSVRGI